MMPFNAKRLTGQIGRSGWLGALFVTALGLCLFGTTLGLRLQRFSFDFPFGLRSVVPPQEAVVVAIDEASYKELNQLHKKTWDRALHAQLLHRLKEAGAKAVVFDIVFSDPDPDAPEGDKQLEAAIRANGKVVLGGEVILDRDLHGVETERLFPPLEAFVNAAAAWGDVTLPIDPDGAIRRHLSTATEPYSLAWTAAKVAGVTITESPERAKEVRWVNYYGPPRTIPSVSYYQALDPKGVSEGFFRDKVVFVGQHLQTGLAGVLKDTFGTVYTRADRGFSSGTEIQATVYLNLLRQNWLKRVPPWLEITLIFLCGTGTGLGLIPRRPMRAVLLAMAGAVAVLLLAWVLFRYGLTWFAWAMVLVQIGAALFWSVLNTSLQLYVEKRLLRQSLEVHLSPARVDQLLSDPTLLKPGGKEQEVSILFSDIADFSKLSRIKLPRELFNLLNAYYSVGLRGIHDRDGTVVQLIGDCIYAVWNAPVPQADHKARACRAALELHQQLVKFDPQQPAIPLRTRVGIHCGPAIVGNLGGEKRFDFATIGESVNLASRLEGLNKYLGTYVLATRAIQSSVEQEILSRFVGLFQFKGFGNPVEIYELLGPMEQAPVSEPWRAAFEAGWKYFQDRKFIAAEQKFRLAIELRQRAEHDTVPEGETPPEDGPSTFYLEKINEFKKEPPLGNWHGEIVMKEK